MSKVQIRTGEMSVRTYIGWDSKSGGTVYAELAKGKKDKGKMVWTIYGKEKSGVKIQDADKIGSILEQQLKEKYL